MHECKGIVIDNKEFPRHEGWAETNEQLEGKEQWNQIESKRSAKLWQSLEGGIPS